MLIRTRKIKTFISQVSKQANAAMAAATSMEAFINETTQTKQKEYMEKNKANLKKHLQYTEPPTRVLPAPTIPTFEGSNKVGFGLICKLIKEYSEYTVTKINQMNEDHKNEILRDVALMTAGNSSLLVSNLDTNREIGKSFVGSVESAAESRTAQIGENNKILEMLRAQGSANEDGFKNLIPGNETPGAINHAEIIKAVQKVHMINENKVQSFIREQTTTLNKTIKDAQIKQTGNGNTARPGPSGTTPPSTAWGTPGFPRPPAAATPNPPNFNPTQTQTPAPTPTATGNGNTQEMNGPQEYVTVTRAVAAKDPVTGNDIVQWTDVHNVKKRNRDFRYTKDAEDSIKQEENRQAATVRARKQIMIYGLPDPPVGDKKTEIGNIRTVADEFGKKWLKEKGFNIQKTDLKNCITQRLWNYGGKTHSGPKPLKVTFDSPEIANKFMAAAKAAGCEGSRTKIKLGKFQNTPTDGLDWPTYYLRPGSTWEERQKFKAKQEERAAHRASPEYERYKGAQERTKNNTHKVVEDDLDGITFLDPEDAGENQEQTEPMSEDEKAEKEKEAKELAEKQHREKEETEVANKESDNDEDISIITSTRIDENGKDMDTSSADDVNDKKRNSTLMSPLNSISQGQLSKKTNNGASSQVA